MDIYEVNDDLIKHLQIRQEIDEQSKQFNECQRDSTKVRFLEKLLLDHQKFPKRECRFGKSNEESLKFRQIGNRQFCAKGVNYFNALKNYNESICNAEKGSECLSVAYANRSAVYYDLKLYDKCLKNIELARSVGYPKHLESKLNKREELCLEQQKSFKENDNISSFTRKLCYPANPQIPFVVDCLEMKESKDFGRYIITTKQLNPGDIIAMEKPYIAIVFNDHRYQRCAYCLSENHLNFIPCDHCTSAMFCNEECYAKAQDEFHEIECPIIDYLFALFNKIHLSAIRTSIKAILKSFSTPTRLIEFLEKEGQSAINVFSLNHSSGITDEQHYHLIHSLETNRDNRTTSDLFQRATIAAVACHQLFKHTKLGEILNDEKSENAFIEIVFRHLQTAPTNFYGLSTAESAYTNDGYGSAAYPFASLINHSCAPNISRITIGTTIYIYVIKVITAGEEVYDDYGFNHCLVGKDSRMSSLKFQYRFICKCEACINDYGTFLELPVKGIPEIANFENFMKLSNFDREFAMKIFPKYCAYLKKYISSYPCQQYFEIQEHLNLCFHIINEDFTFKVACSKTLQK